MWRMMEKIGKGNASSSDIDKLLDVTKQIEGHTICALECGSLANTRFVQAFSELRLKSN